MFLDYSDKTKAAIARLQQFMDAHIAPADAEILAWNRDPAQRWKVWPGLARLKEEAKDAGLWNLFLPVEYGALSPGFTTLEYAPLAELMGRYPWCAEVFNCSAPDTGNMEVFAKFGSDAMKAEWLEPLMRGEIRSAFAMTEPRVASSDATNIETTILPDGDDYVVDGRKWWISGLMDPRCKVMIVMGKTHLDAPRHQQQSMIVVPVGTAGANIIRPLSAFGDYGSPGGHVEIEFKDVRVPKENMILGPGRGFEIAQGRLGPGRIHHAMRSIGQAQRCLELMCQRVTERTSFGRAFSDRSYLRQEIAKSFCEVEQARLLTLKAAAAIDTIGAKGAKDLIAAIKIVAPNVAQAVADRTIQIHGALGLTDDIPAANIMAINRGIRIADGPDEVHASQLGKLLIARYAD